MPEPTVLRVYDPSECDSTGTPLDWERCRACKGAGEVQSSVTPDIDPRDPACETREDPCGDCEGHGSLKAAALAGKEWRAEEWAHATARVRSVVPPRVHRCEDCGHPMSEGMWENGTWTRGDAGQPGTPEWAFAHLRRGNEPPRNLSADPPPTHRSFAVHYSPCDEGCRHGGPMRFGDGDGWDPERAENILVSAVFASEWTHVEASWRPVDIRTLGWPHDLRPERLAILCLRCFASTPSR
jgi:hypothetical protein